MVLRSILYGNDEERHKKQDIFPQEKEKKTEKRQDLTKYLHKN